MKIYINLVMIFAMCSFSCSRDHGKPVASTEGGSFSAREEEVIGTNISMMIDNQRMPLIS